MVVIWSVWEVHVSGLVLNVVCVIHCENGSVEDGAGDGAGKKQKSQQMYSRSVILESLP